MFPMYGILSVSDTKKLEHIQKKFVARSPWLWQLQGTTLIQYFAQLFTQVQNSVHFFHLLRAPQFFLTILGTSPCLPLLVQTVFLLPVLQPLTWCKELSTETLYLFKTYSVLIWYNLNNTDLHFLSTQQSLSFIITFLCVNVQLLCHLKCLRLLSQHFECNVIWWTDMGLLCQYIVLLLLLYVLFFFLWVLFLCMCCICVAVLAL